MDNYRRNDLLDISKGIAIFLMLWGHCIQYGVADSGVDYFENSVFKAIYSFHMPLFMLISGYLFYFSFSKRNLKDLLIHRAQSLLQPIVFGTFFDFLITVALFNAISGNLGSLLEAPWLKNLSSFWFLWSVLVASLAIAVICKKFNNIIIRILLLVSFIPAIALFPNTVLNLFMYPYFILGFFYAEYKDKLHPAIHNLKYFTLVLFPILLCFYERKHFIYTTGLFNIDKYSLFEIIVIDMYRWLIGLIGSIFVLTFVEIIYKYVIKKDSKKLIFNGLSTLGKKSLQIYVISVPLIAAYLPIILQKVLSYFNNENIFIKNIFIYNFIFTLLVAVAYSFILYFIIKLFEKTKISKIMFGK